MSTRNERSRKRKADEISDEEPDHIMAPPPHLPASCLGAILNFLPYSDVRKCMLAGRAMAIGAARYVDVLSIDKASGMDVPALRRFPSVTVLKVVCLIELVEDPDVYKVNAGVAAKVVPLITSLPELKKVYLGGHASGINGGFRCYYDIDDEEVLSDAERDERQLLFRTLVEALGAAYDSRALSPNLKIVGIALLGQIYCDFTEDQRASQQVRVCRTCSRFCRNFPLDSVLELGCASMSDGVLDDGSICYDREEICKIIKSRPGGSDAITSKRAGLLMLCMLKDHVGVYHRQHLLPVGDLCKKVNVHGLLGEAVFVVLENMVSWGYCLSETTYSDVMRLIPHLSKPKEIRFQEEGSKQVQKHTLRNVWASRDHIERLVKLGLPIEADWFEYKNVGAFF